MIQVRRFLPFALAVTTITVADACRKKPEPAPVPAATPVPVDTMAEVRRRDSIEAARRAAEDAARRAREDSVRRANEAAAAEAARLRSALMQEIYFDFDQSDLRDDARSTLDTKVGILMANPDVQLRIAGHTDSRGSTEYNLALGQRRAAAAKRYLTERGVPENRIETVSFGEERPVAMGTDESAYSQNRRDEFEITTGGDRLVRPRTQ